MAGIRMENKIYEVGMYCRLSKDDGTDNESASIATQKSILTDYVKKQGWHLAKTYVDDGYSGTNFQRPSFQNMIKDIESGLINCVITKDLSRLGRNYLDCGLYLEVFFPEHNVRYIAVNDGVDTLNKSAMDITPFRNILNEMYSADVSVKIKSAYRARFQQGKFMGTTAPYGYVKDPADHNHLLIDDKVAHVVREIFDLALAGNGIAKIRKHINKQHILRPAAYAAEQGATGYERYFEENEENRYIWSENSVRGILRSPIYAGNLAGYKRIAANMKSKKRPSKLPEEWEVIPDTHEGIVTQEEFDTVQQLITSRRLPENKGGFENIFAGVIKCADCGYAMRAMSANRRKRPDIIDCVQYSCNNYGRYGNIMCTAHSIEARDLFNAVLTDINRFADMAVNDEKAVRAIEKRLTETDQSKAKALEKEQRKLNKRLAELDRLFSSLYEDKVMERITERNFEMMSGKYQKEQLEIEARLKEVTETLSDSYEKTQGVRDFLSLIRNYQGIKELDATIINALIDKILVSEREKLTDGMVRQEIKIYYKFIGFVGELHITPTKRWTALKPKNCTVCGVEYVPRSGISKYCPACAKKIQREKSNESKRRSRERNRQACIELSAKNDRLMSTSKHIDKICCIILIFTILITVVFCNAESLGVNTLPIMMGYEKKLFDTSKVHTIDIVMDDWDSFIDGCEDEEYVSCAVVIDNEAYKNVAIRAKGNTSLSSVAAYGNDRYSFKIEFDHYDSGKSYHGLDKLSLNNIIQDNTYMKDYMCYQMMGYMGVDAPLCSYVWITVNGEAWGLYLAVEGVEDSFLERNYGTSYGELYKPDSQSMGGGRGNGADISETELAEQFFGEDTASDSDATTDGKFTGGQDMQPPDGDSAGGQDMQPPDGDSSDGQEMQPPDRDSSGGQDMQRPDGDFTGGQDMQRPDGDSSNGQKMEPSAGTESDGQKMQKPDGDMGNKQGGPGGGMGSDDVSLIYSDDEYSSYSNIFDNAKTDITDEDKDRLITSLKSLNENSDIEDVVNVDEVIRYFVVHNFVCNFDSYTGSMIHNYYLYEEDGQLSVIPWDYNLAFGGFTAGGGGSDSATQMVNYPIDTPVSGGTVDSRPMLAWIFADESYMELYYTYFDTFISEYFESGYFENLITETENLIASYVEQDPTKFCTYEEFETGVDTLKSFCLLRAESIRGQLDGTIPSTSDGQQEDDSALVDASSISLTGMGSMGHGGGTPGGGERPD